MLVFTGVGQIHYLNRALMRFDSDRSLNSISVDGEMSTNDFIYILENGAASSGFIIDKENTQEFFKRESTNFATDLAKLVRGGEDTTKFVRITVKATLISSSPFFHVSD